MEPEVEVIRSRANPLLKRIRGVRAGKEPARVVLEGERLVRDAVAAGWTLDVALVAESRAALARELAASGVPVRLVDGGVLAAASTLDTSPGILALAPPPATTRVEDLRLDARSLLLAVDGVADPGNLGALARSAEAAGAQALCVVAGGARPFGEKALRGSMGSLLRLPVVVADDARGLSRRLAAAGVRQVAAATRGGRGWREFDWTGPLALWVGGETGVDPALDVEPERVTIPMAGRVESLNVAVAASLLLFSAGRVGAGPAEGER